MHRKSIDGLTISSFRRVLLCFLKSDNIGCECLGPERAESSSIGGI